MLTWTRVSPGPGFVFHATVFHSHKLFLACLLGVLFSVISQFLTKLTIKTVPFLTAFNYDPLVTDLVDIARRDYLEFCVEKILGMTGDIQKLNSVEFHVKWIGYDETYNSWEPWKNVREVAILHDYLKANNLARIIPKKFTV